LEPMSQSAASTSLLQKGRLEEDKRGKEEEVATRLGNTVSGEAERISRRQADIKGHIRTAIQEHRHPWGKQTRRKKGRRIFFKRARQAGAFALEPSWNGAQDQPGWRKPLDRRLSATTALVPTPDVHSLCRRWRDPPGAARRSQPCRPRKCT